MLFKKLCLILWLSLLALPIYTNAADSHESDRADLRKILEESQQGINTQTLSLFTQHIDDQARVTFLNGEVEIGPQGVEDYFNRMVGKSPDAILDDYQTQAKVIGKARFYGENIAVANGTMQDVFTPKARKPFTFKSRWTATFSKQNDRWKIIALHFSTNAFNNSLTDELQALIKQYAIIAFLIGLGLGALSLSLLWKRKQK